MPTLKITEVEVTQAVLRLSSMHDVIPAEALMDIQLLIDAVDERGSKLFQLAADARNPEYRDRETGTNIHVERILATLERIEGG